MKWAGLILGVWLLGTLATAAQAPETGAPANAMCPVMTDEPIDPEIFTNYQDRRLFFCCTKCRRKFLQDPSVYEEGLAQVWSAPEPVSGGGEDVHQDSSESEAVHDHATDHGAPHGWARLLRWLGKFHPVLVHFPIALLLTAAMAELLVLMKGLSSLAIVARFCIYLGASFAVLASLLGWAAAEFARFGEEVSWVLLTHRWVGTGTAALACVTVLFAELARRKEGTRWLLWYRRALFLTAILVGVAGHFGASLIFGLGHFRW